jgi:hypothetical protein
MTKFTKVLAAMVALAGFNVAQAVSFDYSNIVGTSIDFAGDNTFSFSSNMGGYNFRITEDGPLTGLEGQITGTYTIGAGTNMALVSGTGMFRIDDGMGQWFQATLEWENIFRTGALGGLNYLAAVNLTDFSYTGTNATLLNMLSDGAAINTLTFQFASTGDLNNLRTMAQSTSFSGTVTSVSQVPDGGTTAALIGLGLVGLGIIARRRKV